MLLYTHTNKERNKMTKELETKPAGRYAFAAARDAERKNSNNKSHYSQQQIQRAVTARDLIDTAFSYTNLYINYRAKFIAIKAEGARRKDRMAQEVVKLFENNGYDVVTTAQGMIVRIDR
jgi:hypothetical protein